MIKMSITLSIIIAIVGLGYLASCYKSAILSKDNIEFKPRLSDYGIYTGVSGSLVHTDNYKSYELSTPLFSDYAEKQRLIKLPAGTSLTAVTDGLPEFPDNTVIVKTFFYYNNKSDTSKGKKIIETRLLIKSNGKWNAATYMWNKQQTDADLISAGADVPTNWIDETGKPQVIAYHIPNRAECGMCHINDKEITPIGPKIRNLNFDVIRNGVPVNQLQHLQNQGVFASVNPASFTTLPDWKNTSFSLEQRARAYLDVNCGHCHNNNGLASHISLVLTYQTSLTDSKIPNKKKAIEVLMSRGVMPLIGTTVVDKDGFQLIQNYLQSLR
jgi:uncharacterized repeat protein (TIGR03806 family)